MRFPFALLAAIGLPIFFSLPFQAQTSNSVILEASSTMHGMGGYKEKHLVVRLGNDGKVEWQAPRWGKPNELHSNTIAADRVLAIMERLGQVDPEMIQSKMGPFEIYTDTSIDLPITVKTPKWGRQFLVINPWPGKMTRKPLPKDLKIVICAISQLRAQMAGEPASTMCAQ